MLIDNTNDKEASEEEKAIRKILDDYKLNPMLQPNCADEIIALANKLFIQRVSSSVDVIDYIENDAEIAMPIGELMHEDGRHLTKKEYGKVLLKYLVKELRERYC